MLSGGYKRKLCLAIALIGNPSVLLLDEPSAGMDPEARRQMWNVLAGIKSNGTTATVLTTHSMEEAEALATRLGIMARGGRLKCCGSISHLQNKFSSGLQLKIKTNLPN